MLCCQLFELPSTQSVERRATMQRKGRRNRVVVKLTPSIIPWSHYSSRRSDQTNVVGILGGYSSLSFARKLAEQEIELPFILCVDPALTDGLFLVDGGSFLFRAGKPEKVQTAVEAISMKDFEGAQNLVRIALRVLLIRSVNRIVLACDELRELLPPHDPLWRKCIDPTDALARSAIEHAQSVNMES